MSALLKVAPWYEPAEVTRRERQTMAAVGHALAVVPDEDLRRDYRLMAERLERRRLAR